MERRKIYSRSPSKILETLLVPLAGGTGYFEYLLIVHVSLHCNITSNSRQCLPALYPVLTENGFFLFFPEVSINADFGARSPPVL